MTAEAFFENIQTELKLKLSQAKKSIKIAVAYFTDNEIFDLLCVLVKKGIKVQLIISDENVNFKSDSLSFYELSIVGGKFYISINEDNIILHNKFCIIDDDLILTGSYNWSYKAKKNIENLIAIKDVNLADKFLGEFEKIKSQSVLISANRKDFSIKSGIESFDNKFGGFYSGNLAFLASDPQSGNTSFLLSIINNITQHPDNKVALISLGNSQEVIANKFLSILSGVDIDKIKSGNLNEDEYKQVYFNAGKSRNNFIINGLIQPEIDDIKAIITSLKYKSDLKLVVIDNIEKFQDNTLDHAFDFKYLSSFLIEIKRLARELNIPIICSISIPNNRKRNENEISLNHLGILTDYANVMYILYKKNYYDLNSFKNETSEIFLKALKNNNGILGTISLMQNKSSKKIEDIPNEIILNDSWEVILDKDGYEDNSKLYIQKSIRTNDFIDDDTPF